MALAVEGRRIPLPAAGVNVRVLVGPQVRGDLGPLPLGFSGRAVERPENGLAAAGIERLGVAGDGGDVDRVVVNPRGHVDALVAVAGQLLQPDLLAARGLEGKCGVRGCPENGSVGDAETVGTDAWRVVLVRPHDLAAVEV